MPAHQAAPPLRLPSDTKTVRAKKRDSAKRLQGWWRARIGALTKVFGGPLRYGDGKLYQFSNDDGGREDLRILLDHYSFSNPLKIPLVIKARAPWLTERERPALMQQIGRFPRYWKSPALAEALRLTEAERIALGGVPTIGAIDITSEQREKMRRERYNQKRRQKRRAAKMQSRAAYLATHNISRTKPWLAEKVSRATWYRRRETSLASVNLDTTASRPVSTAKSGRKSAKAQHGHGGNVVIFRAKSTVPAARIIALWRPAYAFMELGGKVHPSQRRAFIAAGLLTVHGEITVLGHAIASPAAPATEGKAAA